MRSEIVTWIRCHGSVCFGMYLACGTVVCCLSSLPVQVKQPSWTRALCYCAEKTGGKKCPLPEAWASVPRGLCWGAISSCLPSWRGIGNPCCAWRVCSVTCTDVFLFHNNHFTSCLENGAFWLCACVDQCSCLRAGPGGRVGLESLQGAEQV